MASVPLPSTHEKLGSSQAVVNAYGRLLILEPRYPLETRTSGWMLIHAPSNTGRAYVAECVNRCHNDEEVVAVGRGYVLYFIAYFKATLHKPTPPPSSHPSRPSLDVLRDEILASLEETPKNHSDAKKFALVRDRYRCMLSGQVDGASFERSPELQATAGISVAPTECSHILPQYLNQGLGDANRLDASASVWTVLQCFGDVRAEELSGPAMHSLTNVLTLKSDYHRSFDRLRIWLDPVEDTEHEYTIGKSFPAYHAELPDRVSFPAPIDPRLLLPDRRYLALHAACAKVIHLSGAGQLIDKILHDAAETKVLSEDGSSGGLLTYLLSVESLAVH